MLDDDETSICCGRIAWETRKTAFLRAQTNCAWRFTPKSQCVYLLDYEVKGSDQTGLDLVGEIMAWKNAILV